MRTNTAAVASPAPKKRHASQKARTAISTTIIYIILIVMSILWILPILWIVLQSFTGEQQASFGKFIPAIWDFQVVAGQANPIAPEIVYGTTLGPFGNYVQLFTNVRATDASFSQIVPSNFNFFGRIVNGRLSLGGFTNTLFIATISTLLSTLLVLCTSYAFSRLRFKGRTVMMRAIMVIGMFPGFLGLVILYNLFRILNSAGIGLFYQSIWGLILVYTGGAGMNYYISKGFFDTISKQIDEAAMVDGATRFQIFYKITIPLSKPIIIYTPVSRPVFLSGANQTVAPGSAATFRIDKEFSELQSVAVDGVTLDKSNYKAWSGSTYVELTAAHMKTLAAGTHTLSVYFTGDTATTTFTISKDATKNPTTGANDFVGAAAALAVVSLLGMAVASRKK